MPAIPQYQQQESISGPLGPGPTDMRGATAVTDALQNGIELVRQKQEESAIVDANDQLQQSRQLWTKNFQDAKDAAQPGAPDFTPTMMKAFDDDAAERLQSAGTQRSRIFLKQRLNDVREGLLRDSLGFQSTAQITDRVAKLATGTDAAKTAAEFHPEDYATLYAEQQATITASGLPADIRAKATEYARTGLSDAAVRGMIRRDPEGALSMLNAAPGYDESPPGMKAKGNLDPFNRPVLNNPDGSISTTSSLSIGTDHGEVLIPSVIDGKRLSKQDAIAHYRKTGENLGTFDTPANADSYATSLHNEQARRLGVAQDPLMASVNALDFKDREQLRTEAEVEIRRRDAQAKQDQAEARSEMTARIADTTAAYERGLPVPNAPSYHDIAAVFENHKDVDRIWQDLRGAQHMGATIQQFDRMSPEQIAEATKGFQLKQGGFGAAEALQRQDAVTQAAIASIRARAADPAGFAVQNGLGWHPLNFADQNEVTQEIRNRVNTQGVVSKQMGVAAPILSKDEAAQMTAGVEAAKPSDALNLYSGLYLAAGSDPAYASIMQQIAKDSPVRAIAGLRAVRSQGVALTMLNGEQILNKTKTAKGNDGRPDSSLYLPNPAALQSAFTDAVGTAFADHPEVADAAFQGVQAYYVGAAAKTGRLASDKQDVDGDLAQEAVKNVLGSVVDYNSRGKVIAPWGMDAAAFKDRVQAAYLKEVKARGMPDYAAGQLSLLGLRSVGHDTYKFMSGDVPLQDKQGNDIIINVAPLHGASGTWDNNRTGATGSW